LTITATSTLGDLPLFRPQNLVDGDTSTSWVANEANATVTMHWPKPRVLTSLTVDDTNGDVASPAEVLISSPFGHRLLHLGKGLDNLIHFAPLDTDSVTISFPKLHERKIHNLLGNLVLAPVGLSQLEFPALKGYEIPQPPPDKVFSEPCGSGPPIDIDGTMYKTSLKGTDADLLLLDPVTLTMCTAYGTVPLAAGSHHLIAPTTQLPFDVSSLTLKQVVKVPAATDAARSARVVSWGAESRQVAIGSGPATYLEVHQNYNAGWNATLDGKRLTPIELDGWQQGYVVPAGKGGTVQLKFGPERLYLFGLLVGALGVLLLLVLLGLGIFRRQRAERLKPSGPWTAQVPLWLAVVGAGAVLFVAGGPLVIAVPILFFLGSRRPAWLPWIAALGMVAAGVIASLNPGTGALSQSGSFSAAAQICALIALAAVLVPLVTRGNLKLRRNHG
jgi:arabinofuranan 3-O-arabinosyltransferase